MIKIPEENKYKGLGIPSSIPCFLCGDFQDLKPSKKDKPYFICDTCGIQCFIRKMDGINRLKEIALDPKLNRIYYKGTFLRNSHIFKTKERIKLIKEKIKQIDIIFLTEESINLGNALRASLKVLEEKYNNYLKSEND